MTTATPTAIKKKTGETPRVRRYVIAGSMALWLMAWITLIDVTTGWVKPLRFIDMPLMILEDKDQLGEKLETLAKPETNFNILLLGSSLTAATAQADGVISSALEPAAYRFHTAANDLDKRLQNTLGVPAKSFNLGIDACMINEDGLLLEQALSHGKTPKLAILMVAPRDFIDNQHDPKSHVFKHLNTPSNVWQRLSFKKTLQENFDTVANDLSTIYSRRSKFRDVAEGFLCGWLHRAPNLYYAQKGDEYWNTFFRGPRLLLSTNGKLKERVIRTRKQAAEVMNGYYKKSYLPVNYPKFRYELDALTDIISDCQRHGIKLVIVNMPRAQFNRVMLPDEFNTKYNQALENVCAKNKVKLFNFETSPLFVVEDFSDGVHLTRDGGRKFNQLLAETLKGASAETLFEHP
jgi:hypothetical protein